MRQRRDLAVVRDVRGRGVEASVASAAKNRRSSNGRAIVRAQARAQLARILCGTSR